MSEQIRPITTYIVLVVSSSRVGGRRSGPIRVGELATVGVSVLMLDARRCNRELEWLRQTITELNS